jgi:YtkA-like protein
MLGGSSSRTELARRRQTTRRLKMIAKLFAGLALAAAISFTGSPAWSAAGDYAFEPVVPETKKGDDVTVELRLVHKPTGKLVPDAVVFRTRVDMAPDNMADMESPVTPLPASAPGIYAFKTDLPMAGRYQFSIAAKVQGEAETVIGKVILKAVK